MTEKKYIAETLKKLQFNPIMESIVDKSVDVGPAVKLVKEFWSYDLMTRKPGPAYRDGVFVGTDLDLACFLSALAERNAVINIPTYKTFRQTKFKEGQQLTSKDNRHGSLLSVVSNQYNFTFSIRIKDMNIISTEDVGDFRTFSLTDFDGNWYDGWKTIQFMPSAKENKFLTENKLWSGSRIVFKNFSHPNRWTSFYGQYYFATKLLINRLKEERTNLNIIKKRMINNGVNYPETDLVFSPKSYTSSGVDKGKQIKVKSFVVEVDFPIIPSVFPDYKDSPENLEMVTRLYREYGKDIEYLQFMTRTTELVHFKNPDRFPAWIKNAKWESDYKLKGGRTKWERLVLYQPGVGEQGVAIRKRTFDKAERVSESYPN